MLATSPLKNPGTTPVGITSYTGCYVLCSSPLTLGMSARLKLY